MSDRDVGERVEQVSIEAVKLSAMHMAFVLRNTIDKVLSYAPADRRQGLFLVLGATAKQSADEVRGDAPKEIKVAVRTLTHVYVDNVLRALATQYGLSLPNVEGDGLKRH
ncbi:hypothetical protein [Methylobacterium segetis]|uniref:hypothetical protein n=1 Tax=Methylobacterium segetis TaxID=2488750 RepID=UPI001048162A|nr:hypothetical protein [Methylobacterium segetis]